jgi:transposase
MLNIGEIVLKADLQQKDVLAKCPEKNLDTAPLRRSRTGRNLVERLINRLKHFRRVATRYEKRAENYEAMLKLAAIKIWL